MWLLSDKKLSFFILVVLPLAISIVALLREVEYFVFGGITYLIIASVFGLYPVRYNTIQYFKDREPLNAVTEYEFIKRIVYVEIPLLVVIAAITIPVAYYDPANPLGDFNAGNLQGIDKVIATFRNPNWGIFAPINTFSYSVTGGIIWLAIQTRKKDFQFYLAKAYFSLIDKNKDQTNKVRCLIKGIKSYDNYIRRKLNLQINTEEVFLGVIGDATIDTNKAMKDILESFKDDYDKLKPIKSISEIAKIKRTEKILIEESLGKRIGDLAAVLGIIVGIITSTLQIIIPAFFSE